MALDGDRPPFLLLNRRYLAWEGWKDREIVCDTSDENAQRGVLSYDVPTPIDILIFFFFPLVLFVFPGTGVSLDLEEFSGRRSGLLWISYEGFERTRAGLVMGNPSLPCIPCKLTLHEVYALPPLPPPIPPWFPPSPYRGRLHSSLLMPARVSGCCISSSFGAHVWKISVPPEAKSTVLAFPRPFPPDGRTTSSVSSLDVYAFASFTVGNPETMAMRFVAIL